MDIRTGTGAKVKFLNENGYDLEREHANTILNTTDEYEVVRLYVHNSSSTVVLKGIEGQFNSVMFANVGDDYPREDWFTLDSYGMMVQR